MACPLSMEGSERENNRARHGGRQGAWERAEESGVSKSESDQNVLSGRGGRAKIEGSLAPHLLPISKRSPEAKRESTRSTG